MVREIIDTMQYVYVMCFLSRASFVTHLTSVPADVVVVVFPHRAHLGPGALAQFSVVRAGTLVALQPPLPLCVLPRPYDRYISSALYC